MSLTDSPYSLRLTTVVAILDILSTRLTGLGANDILQKDTVDLVPKVLSLEVLMEAALVIVETLGKNKSHIPYERALYEEAHRLARNLKRFLQAAE